MKIHLSLIFCFLLSITFTVGQDADGIRRSIDKGIAFLRAAQSTTGSWSSSPRTGIGPTAVILAGLIDAGVPINDPMVSAGLQFLQAAANDDGGIYTPDGFFQNYETCVVVMCFAKANAAAKKQTGSEPFTELLKKADKFLRNRQYTEANNTPPEDPKYGGIGYGNRMTRPDMSNMQFFVDALKSAGAKEDDPAIQKALVFVSRCQNLESEHNNMPFVTANKDGLDGGFIYHNQPDTEGEKSEESLRSYGSMTYAGLKSMIYAGLTANDKRVKAASEWIAKHYTVTENPGRGAAGLFYYYQTMAKALDVQALPVFLDADRKQRNWRKDLSEQLIKVQKTNGSWVNEASKQYMEDDTNLVTGYVLLTLAQCLPELTPQ